MMQINPNKPYHCRSPDYEVEVGGKDENGNLWGRYRQFTKSGAITSWLHITWYPTGNTGIEKEHPLDLIQEPIDFFSAPVNLYDPVKNIPALDLDLSKEPDGEVIVWKDVKVLYAWDKDIGNTKKPTFAQVFNKPIAIKITIKGDEVKVEGGTNFSFIKIEKCHFINGSGGIKI